MPAHRNRSFVGPILLILLGVALLLDQLGIWTLNWADLWRFWPLLLILIGLDILLNRTRWGGLLSLFIALAVIIGVIFYALPALTPPRGLERETFNVPAQGVRTAVVTLGTGVGKLQVSSLEEGANVVEAEMNYDRAWTRVASEASTEGGEARVEIKATQTGRVPFGRSLDEEWRIKLNPAIPMRLDVNAGVSDADLDLKGLGLTRLNLSAGVGSVRVQLPAQGDYQASLNGGVGALTVEIPSDIEARIHVETGLGTLNIAQRYVQDGQYYITKGYNTSKNRVYVDVAGGVGTITIR
jgi:hypothetical protein